MYGAPGHRLHLLRHPPAWAGDTSTIRHSLRSGFAREVLLVAAAMVAYFGIRNLTAGAADKAFSNAERLFAIEEAVGAAWEASIQGLVSGSDTLVMLTNWVYIWGHWPVILTAAIALYLTRRRHYLLLRNAAFVSGAIGFALFALLPLAPPRLVGLGLIDTVSEQSHAYRALQPPGLTNQYAAFPSLHVGWNILVGIVLFLATTHLVVRTFAVVMPLAMAFAVVATANHFVLDVAGGLVVVMLGLAAAYAIERRRTAATLALDGVDRDDRGGRPHTRAAVRRGPSRGQPPR
jgi:membrane-associated phospholipid phosphatase